MASFELLTQDRSVAQKGLLQNSSLKKSCTKPGTFSRPKRLKKGSGFLILRYFFVQFAIAFLFCNSPFTPQLGNQRPAVLPAWLSCPLPAAFSGSPLRGHGRVSHADGHAVFKVQRAKRQQKSRHKTDQPCLRFFWKVMLVGYVTAESQDVQPRRV